MIKSYSMAGDDAGHTWLGMTLYRGSNKIFGEKTVGFWPSGDVDLSNLILPFKGDLQSPDDHTGHQETTISDTIAGKDAPKKIAKVRKTVNKYKNQTYLFIGNNCTHFVNAVRKSAGLGKFSPGFEIPSPRGAIKKAEKNRKEKPYKGKKEKPVKVM